MALLTYAKSAAAALALLLPIGCSTPSTPESPGDDGSRTASQPTQPGEGISWNEAADHVDTRQRVCGPLAGTGTTSDDVFLNLGRDYPDPDRFTVVLWDVGRVQHIDAGTNICVSGVVTSYQGVAQIELRSADAVELE